MRAISLLVFVLLAFPGGLPAQEAPREFPGQRLATVTAGIGNALGWVGVQGERYLLDERVSAFVGLGYTPSFDRGNATGATFAAGLRSFTNGIRHRAFLEASASQLMVEDGLEARRRLYGPGVQGGYQYVSRGGFTLMVSLGVGYALAKLPGASPWASQAGLSLGYTWRRQDSSGGGRRM